MICKIKNKLKSKNGNSFLFMPYLVTFGVMIIYIIMEMGTAYVRQIELQTVTDTMVRAGIYGGMTGSGAQFYEEGHDNKNSSYKHIYVNLDDAIARGLARAIYDENMKGMVALNKSKNEAKRGQYWISDIDICSKKSSFDSSIKNRTIPIWNVTDDKTGAGNYLWTKIAVMESGEEIMSTGNFYVAIKGEYKTLVAFSVLGKETIDMQAFASALATATKVK